jgi:hypothetical protein
LAWLAALLAFGDTPAPPGLLERLNAARMGDLEPTCAGVAPDGEPVIAWRRRTPGGRPSAGGDLAGYSPLRRHYILPVWVDVEPDTPPRKLAREILAALRRGDHLTVLRQNPLAAVEVQEAMAEAETITRASLEWLIQRRRSRHR